MALGSFNTASLYEPTWEHPKVMAQQLVKYLEDITSLVASCGKLKAKRKLQILQVNIIFFLLEVVYGSRSVNNVCGVKDRLLQLQSISF